MKKAPIISLLFFLFTIQITFANLHEPWNQILQTYVKDGFVNYKALKNNPTDIKTLTNYLDKINKEDIEKYSRNDKLAFWINSYNAFTIKLILDHYPQKSIRDIKKPWKKKIWKAAGKTVSLDDIEHIKLREELNEPLIHFAIVCASIGCPNLDSKAFFSKTVQTHLKERATSFFTYPKNFKLEIKKNRVTIHLSKIFKWFGEDFGKNKSEKIAFILNYLKEKDKTAINNTKKIKLKHLDYDWTLNGK